MQSEANMASEREPQTTRARHPSTDVSVNENSQNSNDNIEDQEQEKIEYNPRWMGYLCIMMFSGINFISISNVPRQLRHRIWAASMPFGILTFLIASLVLIHDRCRKKPFGFDYTKSKSGFVEGFTLLFSVVWWVCGVAYITRPGGIAYTVSNIYYSAWLTVVACVYTLNEWSTSKDILSIAEITSVSFTLRYWWIHFTAAFVVFVSSCSLEVQLGDSIANDFLGIKQSALFGILVGLISLIVSSYFILVHYDFITFVEEGGWTELLSSLFLILIWIIAVSIFTKNDGIAATTSGFDCIPLLTRETSGIASIQSIKSCTIIKNGIAEPCRFGQYMPGSNLYFACWACMLSSVAIALKWKAAKALKFAQSKAEQRQQALDQAGGEGYNDVDDETR